MTEKAPDINDLKRAGKFTGDLEKITKPVHAVPKSGEPRILTVKELLDASMLRALDKSPLRAAVTGVKKLDAVTGGLIPGQMWVFGADTNWGKSSFLIMVADENMREGKRVLIVTSEDDESLYGDRLLVRRAGVNALRFRDRKLRPAEMDAVANVVAEGRPDPVFLDARGKPAEAVAEQVQYAIGKHSIDVVMFDYLQEFRSGKSSQDRRNEVSEVASMLKKSVTTMGKTGIIFSQITIQMGKKYPDKHSIRESRDVSNAADTIVLGFTATEAIIRDKGGGQTECIADAGTKCVLVDKVKQGVKGAVAMQWNERSKCFDAMDLPGGDSFYDDMYDEFDGVAQDGIGIPEDDSGRRYP